VLGVPGMGATAVGHTTVIAPNVSDTQLKQDGHIPEGNASRSEPGPRADITSGNNPGLGTTGFPAVPGWDPRDRPGNPNFPSLRTALGL